MRAALTARGSGLVVTLALLSACGGAERKADMIDIDGGLRAIEPDELRRLRARYADVQITVDEASVRAEDRAVLADLVKASAVMGRLFWRQASAEGTATKERLERLAAAAQGPARAHLEALAEYVDLNAGPWDRLDDFRPFVGNAPKPEGGTFYPPDVSKAALEPLLAAGAPQREAFESPFTVVRWAGDGPGRRLVAVPYSEEYRADLAEAAAYLRSAASKTRDPVLARYLRSRADAFASNDYFQSDMDWMDLGTAPAEVASPIEVVIGPYEVYEDRLMGLKASFEAFVTLRDDEDSRKLARVASMLDELEANLPIDDRHKNFSRGKSSPISVVNVVYTAGDTAAGVQTTAFNLPNDERVRAAKGSKKVMLKNVGRAKFDNSLIPIARAVVDPALLPLIDFEAYFNNILMHEVSHGLGPGFITAPDGTRRTVNSALRDTYSFIEECKADVLGVWSTLYLVRKGFGPAALADRTMATFLAGIFRSVRFGVEEAHGKANIMQFNYLRKQGAFTWDAATGRFGLVADRFEPAIRALARDLLTIEAEGDQAAAERFIAEYGRMPDEVASALARLGHVPVDIRPHYTLGEKLLRE